MSGVCERRDVAVQGRRSKANQTSSGHVIKQAAESRPQHLAIRPSGDVALTTTASVVTRQYSKSDVGS